MCLMCDITGRDYYHKDVVSEDPDINNQDTGSSEAKTLNFNDGNQKNWKLENLEMLCYNCYFLNVGNVWSDNQLQQMEDYNQKNKFNNDPEPDWEMDKSHIEHLKDLGLWDEKEDGEEFVDFT